MSRRFPREDFAPAPEPYFRWRGGEITRIEGFSDAVFAFAVSLLVVALEVPHSFSELVDVLRGFPGFVASFAMLYLFWSYHYRYFRRYGLEDHFTKWLNALLLLLVLFSVYPLKFLFNQVLQGAAGMPSGAHVLGRVTPEEWGALLRIYGLGLGGIFCCYAGLYFHAFRLRAQLRLTRAEEILTLGSIRGYGMTIGVCLFSLALVQCGWPTTAGMIYLLLIVTVPLIRRYHERSARLAEEAWLARRAAENRR
ncbi:MAG: hypothetical protein JWM88_560 [Verrucomicrobia bacterium]|nr:hypothetical protein [Verrucomicrobiota bacterium]